MAVPTVTKPGTQTSVKNTAITPFQVVASESPTEYKSSGLPAGLSIASSTGLISGTPTTVEKAKVKLSAKNGTGTSSEVEFEWVVNKDTEETTKEAVTNPQTVKLTANTVATVELGVVTDLVSVIAHKSLKKDAYFTVDGTLPIIGFGYFVGAEGVTHSSETVARVNANPIVVKLISEEEGQITVVGHEGIL
jgi:hypothetical protein